MPKKDANLNAEGKRIKEKDDKKKDWLRWGPYISERQWGTVREDYSEDGDAWNYITHDMSRFRAYRWGEDGIAGISDRYCNICFAVALWNGKDPILKERLFGLNNAEGNHGEDVKEHYFYLANVPSHSYMKYLYKYPQNAYPYDELVKRNKQAVKTDPEIEIQDTGVFDDHQYFDVFVEYAKKDVEDIFIKISVSNRYHEPATLHLLPTIWMRNHWSFRDMKEKPVIRLQKGSVQDHLRIEHEYVGEYRLYFDKGDHLLFTENETNEKQLYQTENDHPYKKDLIHDAVITGDFSAATEKQEGTKCSAYYQMTVDAGQTSIVRLRLTKGSPAGPFAGFDELFKIREEECTAFYKNLTPGISDEEFQIQLQALSGLLWSKQYYNYDVEKWLMGDPKQPSPPDSRLKGRNSNWKTFRNHDVLLMPDKWEYPWFASWDAAFHCVTMALIDPEFAKSQLLLYTKEWYMDPGGKIPAYEWSFDDTNPPVQAWAALMIYRLDRQKNNKGDIDFLKRVFNKLALNFTWWVTKEDLGQNTVFEGGFLGMDNLGVFDRSHNIPDGARLEQTDGSAWMAMYCLNMLQISLEISKEDPVFEDMATKYFGHFIFIAEALNKMTSENEGIWDEQDGFFYDKLVFKDGSMQPIKVRSIESILSLMAVLTIEDETFKKLPDFKRSFEWFKENRLDLLQFPVIQQDDKKKSVMLSLVPPDRLSRLIGVLLNREQLLSEFGIRSLSKEYLKPYEININGKKYGINYEPAESTTGLFGGNSNWRGPVWFPLNYILSRSLLEYYKYFGDNYKVEFPTGSDNLCDFKQVAKHINDSLLGIFKAGEDGVRPVNLLYKNLFADDFYKNLILFHEYFDGDNGRGVGASHQTGWTALVANMIHDNRK